MDPKQVTDLLAEASLAEESHTFDDPKLQEAYNICDAAYKEVMIMAKDITYWICSEPDFCSIKQPKKLFQNSKASGMRAEVSKATRIVKMGAYNLALVMMDVDKWAELLSHIVTKAVYVQNDLLERLAEASDIMDVRMICAEHQLPTPSVKTRKFSFLRFLKHIQHEVFAVFDVSSNYFESILGHDQLQCQRRPSGVLINGINGDSEVTWIENVEAYAPEINIFASLINSTLAFGAQRWIYALFWKLMPDQSKFIHCGLKVHPGGIPSLVLDRAAGYRLLELTQSMKKFYMNCTSHAPDDSSFENQGVAGILKVIQGHTDAFVASASFRIEANPFSVFQLLPLAENPEQLGVLFKFATSDGATSDDTNCISLEKKEVGEYVLTEASGDGFCSFLIYASIFQQQIDRVIIEGRAIDLPLLPVGFAVMPDGSDGLQSEASLVTFVWNKQFHNGMCGSKDQFQREFNSAVDEIIAMMNIGEGDDK